MHLEGTKYSLPVNWAMTGLFWLWFMAFVIYHVGWILAIMKYFLMSCGDWIFRWFTSSLLLYQGYWAWPVAKWNQRLGTHLMKGSLKKKAWLSFSGTWRMSACGFTHWEDGCGPGPGADMERAGGAVSLLPVQEILSGLSEPKANCWCMACWHAKVCAV